MKVQEEMGEEKGRPVEVEGADKEEQVSVGGQRKERKRQIQSQRKRVQVTGRWWKKQWKGVIVKWGMRMTFLKVPHLKRKLRNNSRELQVPRKGQQVWGRRSKQRPRETQSPDPVWRKIQRTSKANPGLS